MALIEHPKGSTVRTDELGEYVHYHRVCNICNVELTSRNRPSAGSLRCKECIQVVARQVYAEDHPKAVKEIPEPKVKATRAKKPPGGPEKQAIHKLLTAFLSFPTIKEHKDALQSALMVYELKALWPR